MAKKKPRKPTQLTVYVQPELRERMRQVSERWAVSWSRLAQEAWAAKCSELEEQDRELEAAKRKRRGKR